MCPHPGAPGLQHNRTSSPPLQHINTWTYRRTDSAAGIKRHRSMKYLVTGAAGFIGMHVSAALLDRGDQVVGLDSLNPYYSVKLKRDRLLQLTPRGGFRFQEGDLTDQPLLNSLFTAEKFDVVINLAAQAGVRYSLT